MVYVNCDGDVDWFIATYNVGFTVKIIFERIIRCNVAKNGVNFIAAAIRFSRSFFQKQEGAFEDRRIDLKFEWIGILVSGALEERWIDLDVSRKYWVSIYNPIDTILV